MNGVVANSNLCPECRTAICKDRRPVRVIGIDNNVEDTELVLSSSEDDESERSMSASENDEPEPY